MNAENTGPIWITGAAGFIGYHLSSRLLRDGFQVVGIDNLDDYYDVNLKQARLDRLLESPGFTFSKTDIAHREPMEELFERRAPWRVVHLAAQAGVRHSLENPYVYIQSNVRGFLHILEGCRRTKVNHLVYASSSSVYGANTHMPFSVSDNVDHPVSLYAATKKTSELMAHTYSHLYRVPCSGLRFFTVYGPWGRPDMALFLFTKAILEDRSIDVFNYGKMLRDFTYVDDIVEGVVRIMDHLPEPDPDWSGDRPDPACSNAPYRLYNIGNNEPVELERFIQAIETALGKEAKKNLLPMQPGDVPATYADISGLERAVGFRPSTPLETGIQRFVDWYRSYYGV
jgi:UDP-glucuronate 4-epimerase